jgi:hypothetical protein
MTGHNGHFYAGILSIRKHLGNNNWQTLYGFGVSIDAMASYKDKLFVGNQFGVFKFDEKANQPISISDQLSWITQMYVANNQLFIGGGFNSGSLTGIASFDGETLSVVGKGFSTVPPGFSLVVNGLTSHNGDLVATGRFKNAGNTQVNSLARWDGNTWLPFGTGLYWEQHPEGYDYGNAVASLNGKLYVGGFFDSVDGNEIPNLAQWEGITGAVLEQIILEIFRIWLLLTAFCTLQATM